MTVDVRATKRAWRQTVWGTALAMVGMTALLVYLLTQPVPDYEAVRVLLLIIVLMPVVLGVAFLISRFIEGLPR